MMLKPAMSARSCVTLNATKRYNVLQQSDTDISSLIGDQGFFKTPSLGLDRYRSRVQVKLAINYGLTAMCACLRCHQAMTSLGLQQPPELEPRPTASQALAGESY